MHVQARAPLPAARLAIRVSPRSASGAAPRPAPTHRPRPPCPQANLQVHEEKAEKAKESIPRFEEMARVAKEEHDGAVNLKRLEEQKETMEPMVAWAQVASKEREMRLLTEEARQADEGVEKVQEKLDALLSELASLEERKNGVDAELHQLHAEFERRQSDAVRAQQHAKEPQKAMKAAARNLEAATADRAENESSLEVAKDTLANLESTLEDRQQARRPSQATRAAPSRLPHRCADARRLSCHRAGAGRRAGEEAA